MEIGIVNNHKEIKVMKTLNFFYVTFIFLIISNLAYTQSGESKFKRVIINSNEKRVTPLYPSFTINNLNFTDANMNRQLDAEETGVLGFYIKNTGTILLDELSINLNLPDSVKNISFIKNQVVKLINPGDSMYVKIPLSTDEKLKDGEVSFKIVINDTRSDSVRFAMLNIPTRAALPVPVFTWITPDTTRAQSDFGVLNITGFVKTKTNIAWIKVFINGEIPDDSKSFEIMATERSNEYRIKRTITLNEGDNEIKIEVKNDQGVSTSDARYVNYYVQKIDQTYVEKRLALVVGNAEYKNTNPLQNPVNDARAIAQALKDVGFTVLLYINSDLKTMKKAMDEFGEKLKNYTVGLFYYAGHGMQVKGNNYLIPVDASLKVEQDVDYDCVDAGRLLGKMEAATTSTNIVILDACRDNPFSRSWGGRSTGKEGTGLAFMNASSGTIIAYATSPGKTASDGTGKNGLYTEAILQNIKIPSLPIEDFFKNVRVLVEKKSNGKQTPWESTSLKGNFFFKIK